MNQPMVVDRAAWLEARMALLKREKAATRELDALAKARQGLPWVEVTGLYELQSSNGPLSFEEMFEGRSQLIVYHFMFGSDWTSLCDGCSAWAAALDGTLGEIHRVDATLVVVSSAPIEQIEAAQKNKGWSFPWYSSADSGFNTDFNMSVDKRITSQTIGDEIIGYDRGESGGINVFVRKEAGFYHTYSAHNRGIQQMNGAFGYVDLLPFGGN